MIDAEFTPRILQQEYYQILTCAGYKVGKVAMLKLGVKILKEVFISGSDDNSWIKVLEGLPSVAKIKTSSLIFPFVTDGLNKVCKVYFSETYMFIRAGNVGEIYDAIFCYLLD